MMQLLYGMWLMWFILCLCAVRTDITGGFIVMALVVPAVVVAVVRGLWLLVQFVKFKWERRG